MARPKTQRPADATDAIAAANIDHDALAEAGAAATVLATNVALVEVDYPVDLPYRLEAFVATIRQYAAESGQRLLIIGRMLIQIREREPLDVYHSALDSAGLTPRFAQRAMQAAVKIGNRTTLRQLGGSKLLELLSEDDDALDALADGGTLAGATLDEIDRMSVRELRDTLRQER
ncbi:MAG TPA: hypothetical protein VFN09_08370, partial [Rhodanobacteraceae bacterium]|nr:hypothetical protein [Rhodanobacteraceae bacterium]